MESNQFDAIIVGTGITESIVAAALSKAGYKVAHVDENGYYGGDEASLAPDELSALGSPSTSRTESISANRQVQDVVCNPTTLESSRRYSLSLLPCVIPATGPMVDDLVASGVARYGGFKLLDKVAVYSDGILKAVPGSKEDIFKSKSISLVDKRKLMRFLLFASSQYEDSQELKGKEDMPFVDFLRHVFSLPEDLANAIAYALAFCTFASDQVLPALARIRLAMRSTGRYGPSPYLVGHYGGLGELAQGFCRASAVSGGVYILGHRIIALEKLAGDDADLSATHPYTLTLDSFPEKLLAKVVISSPSKPLDILPKQDSAISRGGRMMACAIAIIGFPVTFPSSSQTEAPASLAGQLSEGEGAQPPEPTESSVDSAVIVFPPGSVSDSLAEGSVRVIINGEATMSCPQGKHILYLSTPCPVSDDDSQGSSRSSEELLRPYLDHTLRALAPSTVVPAPIYTAFFTRAAVAVGDAAANADPNVLICPPFDAHFADCADAASVAAEKVFWDTVKILPQPVEPIENMWAPLVPVDDDDD